MSFNITKKSPTPGEITTSLINSTDGAGLHFADAGYIDLTNAAGAEFGTSDFSVEFILNQTEDNSVDNYIYFTHISGNSRLYFRNDISENLLRITWVNSGGSSQARDIAYDMAADYGVPTHYALTCDRDGDATLYKNGNSVGSIDISAESSIDLGAANTTTSRFGSSDNYGVIGTFFRFRTWNKSLSAAEVTASYENAALNFADQWGSETELVTNGDFASATGWGLISVTVSGGVASFADPSGGWQLARRTDWAITAGKKYRLEFTVSNHSSSGELQLTQYGGTSPIVTLDSITGNGSVVTEFTAANSSSGGTLFGKLGSTFVGDIDNLSCVEIGCVADYDLAMANPAISTTVQNRNDTISADGTASSTGVKQITVVEQLNAKAARIGTTAATPADGELLVSGLVTASGGFEAHNSALTSDGKLQLSPSADYYIRGGSTIGYTRVQGLNSVKLYASGTKILTASTTGLAVVGTLSSSSLATFANGIDVSNGFLTIGDWSGLVIASGEITVTDSFDHVDTEGSASTDDLDTINGGSDGTLLYLGVTSSSRTVVYKDGTGNLALAGDFSADAGADFITLLKSGGTWYEQSRSNNA